MTNYRKEANSLGQLSELRYRVRDLQTEKFLGGAFDNEAKALRQLAAVTGSGKYPDSRFTVVAIQPDGSFIDPVSLYEAPQVDILEDK